MYQDTQLLFLFCDTAIHAGVGAGLGAIDLPIQRERATDYPTFYSSGLKGSLRSVMPDDATTNAIFGPRLVDGRGSLDKAGMIVVGDANILAFPVRSLKGVYVWVTCLNVLARLQRELKVSNQELVAGFDKIPQPSPGAAWVVRPPAGNVRKYDPCVNGNKVYLEDFDFEVNHKAYDPAPIAKWLSEHALPTGYTHWRERMLDMLVIVHDDVFRDFTRFATEVHTRVALNDQKTVISGALWTEEGLPAETLLYAPIRATNERTTGSTLTPKTALEQVKQRAKSRIQIGGDETTGHGLVSLTWYTPQATLPATAQPAQQPL